MRCGTTLFTVTTGGLVGTVVGAVDEAEGDAGSAGLDSAGPETAGAGPVGTGVAPDAELDKKMQDLWTEMLQAQ